MFIVITRYRNKSKELINSNLITRIFTYNNVTVIVLNDTSSFEVKENFNDLCIQLLK